VQPEPSEKVPTKPSINLAGILNRPDLLLGLAGLITFIGSFTPWVSGGYSGVTASVSGWDIGYGKITLFLGLFMLYAAAVRLKIMVIMGGLFPLGSISAVCGVLTIITAVVAWDFMSWGAGVAGGTMSAGWGLWVMFIAGFIALFAALKEYVKGSILQKLSRPPAPTQPAQNP